MKQIFLYSKSKFSFKNIKPKLHPNGKSMVNPNAFSRNLFPTFLSSSFFKCINLNILPKPFHFSISPLSSFIKSFQPIKQFCVSKNEIKSVEASSVNQEISLRPYQSACIKESLQAFGNDIKRQLVSLPVASGKSYIFAKIIQQLPVPKQVPSATKVLVLAHREELLDQAATTILKVNPNLNIQIERAESFADIDVADVIVASVPTLGRQGSKRLEKFDPTRFKCIIIDEAHHSVAPTYMAIINHFKALEKNSHILLWGCTATVNRSDGIGLENVYDKIIFHKGLSELMEENWICSIQSFKVSTSVSLADVDIVDNDFIQSQLASTINIPARNKLIVEWWKKNGQSFRSTLVFAVNVEHIHQLEKHFREENIDARSVWGETPSSERISLIRQFKEGKFPVLINCGVFTEGVDIPEIDCILLARPTTSSVLYIQMIGRGLRLTETKKTCVVVDFVDNSAKHSLVTSPSLFGLNSQFDAQGENLLKLYKEICERIDQNPNIINARSTKEIELSSLQSTALLENVQTLDPDIRQIVSYAHWFQVNSHHFILPLRFKNPSQANIVVSSMKGSALLKSHATSASSLSPEITHQDLNTSTFVAQIGLYKGENFVHIHENPNFVDLIQSVEAYVQEKYPGVITLISKLASWRTQPPSEAQLNQCKKFQIPIPDNSETLTKGKVFTMINEKKYSNRYEICSEIDLPGTKFQWYLIRSRFGTAETKYFLFFPIQKSGHIEIKEDVLGKFTATMFQSSFGKSVIKVLSKSSSIYEAFANAEIHVKESESIAPPLQKSAWTSEPASEKQINFLKEKFGVQKISDSLTKGQVSAIFFNKSFDKPREGSPSQTSQVSETPQKKEKPKTQPQPEIQNQQSQTPQPPEEFQQKKNKSKTQTQQTSQINENHQQEKKAKTSQKNTKVVAIEGELKQEENVPQTPVRKIVHRKKHIIEK